MIDTDLQGQCQALCDALRTEIPSLEFIQPAVSQVFYEYVAQSALLIIGWLFHLDQIA